MSALQRFNERLHDFDVGAVRAVATNTLRVAKNAPGFLIRADRRSVPDRGDRRP